MPLPCFTSPSVGLTQTSLAATGLFLKAQQTIINFCTLQSGSPPRTPWHWKDKLVQSPCSKTCYQVFFTRLFVPRHDAIGGEEPATLYIRFASYALVVVAIQLSPDWATFSQVGSLWRSTRTVYSQSGFLSRANWCRRCSQKSRDWWRIQGIT